MTRERYLGLLDELDRAVGAMGEAVLQTIASSIAILESHDVASAKRLIVEDSEIDAMRHGIEEQAFLVIATQQPAASDLRLVTASSTVASELERIGDYCSGIAKLTLTMAAEPRAAPNQAVSSMATVTCQLLRRALQAFRSRDVEAAASIWTRDDEVDSLYQSFFAQQINEMVNHKKRVRRGTYMLWVAHNVERMADRVTNIAEAVAFVATGDVASFREQIEAESVPGV